MPLQLKFLNFFFSITLFNIDKLLSELSNSFYIIENMLFSIKSYMLSKIPNNIIIINEF